MPVSPPALGLVWFRQDLRLADHEPLHRAAGECGRLIPLYCFDPRHFGETSFGFPKTGAWRARFLWEAVTDLRQSLRTLGSELILRTGRPEDVIPELAQTLGITDFYYYQAVTPEELAAETALAEKLSTLKVNLQGYWGTSLLHPEDLPFPPAELPDLFTQFRRRVEGEGSRKKKLAPVPVRAPYPVPANLPPCPDLEPGDLPAPENFNLTFLDADPRAVLPFQGGETAGKARVSAYLWERDCLRTYKETRNGLLGADYSSKFSPWLALGCLSPRWLYGEIRRYEAERVKNDSTYWLFFELLWRDFFYFVAQKYGARLFYPSGLRGLTLPWSRDWDLFRRWSEGRTGYPLVDANLRELRLTGFMSNRGRQNVASFLTKNLGLDWRLGAEWFESWLIDYDVCSNWGNWNYVAGVGNDRREFRYFNIAKQSRDYDPQGDYLRHWLPELAALAGDKIHEPGKLTQGEQSRFDIKLGRDYPRPLVDFEDSLARQRALFGIC
ncbi:MAG: DASH family cryptochrome [Cyanobacteria bacterium RI_101]|nr:DASH family cryptochrome [Cyanobacteria bacterium RI_101]